MGWPGFAASEEDEQDLLVEHICGSCGIVRCLPFDLGTEFLCRDVELKCVEALSDFAHLHPGASEDEGEGEQLVPHSCGRCRAQRFLPFELGDEFLCPDVGLECDGASGDTSSVNCCCHCGAERVLPFDFGEEFFCELAGYDCDYSTEAARLRAALSSEEEESEEEGFDEDELILHVCATCGAQRHIPFDLRSSFVCGDAGLECERSENQEQFSNTCAICGAKKLCPFSLTDGFVCGDCNMKARQRLPRYELPDLPEGPREEESEDDDLDPQTREEIRRANERVQLLWKVLIQDLSATDSAKLFMDHGQDPPSKEELLDLRSNTLKNFRMQTTGARQAARSALKSKNKKGPEKRYLNNQLVTVAKKDKYIHEAKESAEDKAKTSVELYIIGIGRGGRHAVKIAREEKKKGPMSHK